jgi:hypothetical protein
MVSDALVCWTAAGLQLRQAVGGQASLRINQHPVPAAALAAARSPPRLTENMGQPNFDVRQAAANFPHNVAGDLSGEWAVGGLVTCRDLPIGCCSQASGKHTPGGTRA